MNRCFGQKYCDCAKTAMKEMSHRLVVEQIENQCPHQEIDPVFEQIAREAANSISPSDGVKVDIEEGGIIFKRLRKRNDEIELLEAYSKFLMEHGYLDTDWKDESPYSIDEFLKDRA